LTILAIITIEVERLKEKTKFDTWIESQPFIQRNVLNIPLRIGRLAIWPHLRRADVITPVRWRIGIDFGWLKRGLQEDQKIPSVSLTIFDERWIWCDERSCNPVIWEYQRKHGIDKIPKNYCIRRVTPRWKIWVKYPEYEQYPVNERGERVV